MFKIINSFNEIIVYGPKTLVICDIDNTLFYWKKKSKDFYYLIPKDYALTDDEIENEASDFLKVYKTLCSPIMTDSIGFNNLLNKLNLLTGSKIIFLTARTIDINNNNKFTRKHFEANNLVYDDYDIHYTNNSISKGEYIKTHINLNDYDEILFIDDYITYIKTVNDIFPNIKCYKFEIKQ